MNEALKTFLVGLPIFLGVPWVCLAFMVNFDTGQSPKGDYQFGKTWRVDYHEQRTFWAVYYTSWGPAVFIAFIFPYQPWLALPIGSLIACYGAATWMHRKWDEYSWKRKVTSFCIYVLGGWLSVGLSVWVVLDGITVERVAEV